MLHFGEQNDIGRAKKFSAPRLRDEVDAFGGAAREHDLVCAGSADKIGHTLPRFFVMLSCPRAQRVETAMHIRIFVFVVIANDIEDKARLLGAGGAIEVNQRMTVYPLTQNRKILA